MKSSRYTGVCVGGPYDGRQMVSVRPIVIIEILPTAPMMRLLGAADERVGYMTGRYRHLEGKWQWNPNYSVDSTNRKI